jgi:putative membrane protein
LVPFAPDNAALAQPARSSIAVIEFRLPSDIFYLTSSIFDLPQYHPTRDEYESSKTNHRAPMNQNLQHPPDHQTFDPFSITRPAPVLMFYYTLLSLLAGPAFVFPLLPLVCKFLTLRYRFDGKGIATSHGVFFKKETLLTYRRIQDIHLTNNIVQRWLGLATVSIQTASGNTGAEVAIEGVLEAEALRDFLYQKMRGARGLDHDDAAPLSAIGEAASAAGAIQTQNTNDEATVLLRDIRDALVSLSNRKGEQP